MTSTYIPADYKATAEEYRREVKKFYRRARRDAKYSAQQYQFAAGQLRHARWLNQRPDLWSYDFGTPADAEGFARTATRSDNYLRSHFSATENARFYNKLARDYDDMAGRRDEHRQVPIPSDSSGDRGPEAGLPH